MVSKTIKPSGGLLVLGAAVLFLAGLWWFGPNRSGGACEALAACS